MWRIYRAVIGNIVFANVVLVTLICVGGLATVSMVRESMPNYSLPLVEVVVPYPGADPEEVEEGISQKVEAAVNGLEGVKLYQTTSRENHSRVVVQGVEGYSVDRLKDAIRNAVDAIDTFPVGAEKPRISQITEDEVVIRVMVWGDLPERQLKSLAEEVREELHALPEISQTHVLDTRAYEISIEVSEEKLRAYGLSLGEISEAIRRSSLNLSTGSMRLKGEEIRIRTVGKRYAGPEFSSIVVKSSPEGGMITLDDVAEIHDGFVEERIFSTFNGRPCASVEVQQVGGEDSLLIAEKVREYVEKKEAELPQGAHISAGFDNTDFIRNQIAILTRNGLLGLALVVFVLWLFLDTRLSFWVAMGIPISLAGAMILLWLWGASINQISLVALIVVVGIIVDDAIVVGESIFHHRSLGKSPLDASVDGVREVGLPVLASVSTTIVANLPLAFISGMMGLIMSVVPMVIIAALLVSLVECLFLLPAHLNHRKSASEKKKVFAKVRKGFNLQQRVSAGLERFVERVYVPFVSRVVHHRYLTLSAGFAIILLTVGLVGGGVVSVIMWPGMDGDMIDVTVEFPPGTPRETVKEAVDRIREGLERVSETMETRSGEALVQDVYTTVPYRVDTAGWIVVMLAPTERRGVSTQTIKRAWKKEVGPIPGAIMLSYDDTQMSVGGQDISYWLQGRDLAMLRKASAAFKEKLGTYEGVYQIGDNFRPGKTELQVTLKPEAHTLGITMQDLSAHLHAGYYGEEAVRLQRGREDVRVRVRYPQSHRQTLAELNRIRIRTPDGHVAPFSSVANVSFHEGVSSIQAINGVRGVSVSASVDRNSANPHDINVDIQENYLPGLVKNYPGLVWNVSGAEQNNQETMESLKRGFLIALLGIFVILATLFRSYVQPILIMLIIPFGMVGAVLGHLVMGIPISFLSLFGIVALAGVLVNDSIVLIERINSNIAKGLSVEEAVKKGGARRFRAVFLTSLSTCVGLTPLILEKSMQAQIVIPMAVSLAGGVAFGTLLTLILIPALFIILNDARRVAHRALHGTWPSREEVEPSSTRDEQTVVPGDTVAVS